MKKTLRHQEQRSSRRSSTSAHSERTGRNLTGLRSGGTHAASRPQHSEGSGAPDPGPLFYGRPLLRRWCTSPYHSGRILDPTVKFRRSSAAVYRRPLEEVFALASDPKKDPDWSAVVEQVEATGPLEVGVHLIQRVHLLGRRAHVPVEVLEYVPPERVVLRASIPHIHVLGWRLFERTRDGTRVTFRAQAWLGGLFSLTTPLFIRTARRHLEEDLAQLRRLLESAAFPQPLQAT